MPPVDMGPGRRRSPAKKGGRQRASQVQPGAWGRTSPEGVISADLTKSGEQEGGWGMGAGGLGRGGMCSRDATRAKGIYPNNSSKTMSAPAQEKHTEKGGSQRQGREGGGAGSREGGGGVRSRAGVGWASRSQARHVAHQKQQPLAQRKSTSVTRRWPHRLPRCHQLPAALGRYRLPGGQEGASPPRWCPHLSACWAAPIGESVSSKAR